MVNWNKLYIYVSIVFIVYIEDGNCEVRYLENDSSFYMKKLVFCIFNFKIV